jgi:hypothetical protein
LRTQYQKEQEQQHVSTQTKFNYGQSVVSLALDTFFCRNVYAHIRVPLYHFPVSWWIGPVWIPLDLSKYDLTSSMGNGEIAQEGVTNRRDQVVTRRVDNLISGHVYSALMVFLRLSYRDLPDGSRIPERMFVLHRLGLLQAGELRDGQKVQR